MTKWEYKCVKLIYVLPHLNELGQKGWELVALETDRSNYLAMFGYFKRPIEEALIDE